MRTRFQKTIIAITDFMKLVTPAMVLILVICLVALFIVMERMG
jgi:hypothetical protein